jgi:hypothetical protein
MTDQTALETAVAVATRLRAEGHDVRAQGADDVADMLRTAARLEGQEKPVGRAAVLAEADWIVEHCPDHGCVEPATDGCHCEIADRLRRMADEAQPADMRAWQQEWDSRPNGADVSDLIEITPAVTLHAIPLPGSNGISACCGRPPCEFVGERVTRDPAKVTCTGPAAGARQDTHPPSPPA